MGNGDHSYWVGAGRTRHLDSRLCKSLCLPLFLNKRTTRHLEYEQEEKKDQCLNCVTSVTLHAKLSELSLVSSVLCCCWRLRHCHWASASIREWMIVLMSFLGLWRSTRRSQSRRSSWTSWDRTRRSRSLRPSSMPSLLCVSNIPLWLRSARLGLQQFIFLFWCMPSVTAPPFSLLFCSYYAWKKLVKKGQRE